MSEAVLGRRYGPVLRTGCRHSHPDQPKTEAVGLVVLVVQALGLTA